MAKQTTPRPRSRTGKKESLRIACLPAVSALFSTAPERVERLYFAARMKTHVGAFCAQLAGMRKPYRLVEADELARIAGSILHGGVVALASPRPLPLLDPVSVEEWACDRQVLLLLDGVGNPHNLGAIARKAAFFGLPRIVISDRPAQARPSDASYRVAEGGLEYVQLYGAPHFVHMLRHVRRSYQVVGAAAENGQPIGALRATERPIALVLGNEERGLPRATLAACDAIVTIAGSGRIQSLNVSATAAVLLHVFAG